jgi:thiol-disulfide isomerase/thioredoxin
MMARYKVLWFVLGMTAGMCLCLVALVAGIIVVVALSGSSEAEEQAFKGATGPGKLAQDFDLPALSGKTVSLSQYQGRPVLISFGTTWCAACEDELPVLQRLHEQYPDLNVLLVDPGESVNVVKSYHTGKGTTFPVVVDAKREAARRYQVYAYPTLIFIDRSGVIQKAQVGSMTEDEFAQALATIGVK